MVNHTSIFNRRSNNSSPKVAVQTTKPGYLTVNPGDRIIPGNQTIEEKAQQVAVDAPDITGDWIKVPTYFVVEYPNGEKKALHHVKDAKAISEVIQQARFDQETWQPDTQAVRKNLNLSGFIFILALLTITIPVLLGIF